MLPEQTETKLQMTEEERRKIIRLMKRVSRRSLLRRVVEGKTGAILASRESASHLTTLLNTTPETKWRERLVAAIVLRYVPIATEEESATARALSKTLQTDYKGRIAAAAMRGGACYIFALAATLASAILYDKTEKLLIFGAVLFAAAILLWLAIPFVFLLSPIRHAAQNAKVQLATAETLARRQLPESVGALAKASRGKKRLSYMAQCALIRLLPTITEAHYGRLPTNATPELCALLFETDTFENLIPLTAEAIGKIGDGRAVEPMQKFAQTARTPKLREMAESILPILIARREQENASNTLLRHSSAPPVDAGQLLRAASAAPATPPEQLLRPSAGTDAAPDAEK